MLTWSGCHVTKGFGAPTIRDIAVQSMRLVRFSGAAEVFWPVGMHMMLVADLMPKTLEKPRLCAGAAGGVFIDPNHEPAVNPWLEVYALLHDAAEVCVADVPRPMKTAEARTVEEAVQYRIYRALGVPDPTVQEIAAVKEADFRAALAEGVCGCAGRGFQETQTGFRHDPEAEQILRSTLPKCEPIDLALLNPDGFWPLEYERRLRAALRTAQQSVSYAPDKEVDGATRVRRAMEAFVRAEAADFAAVSYGQLHGDPKPLLHAIEDLYRSQEHRPSCQAVKQAIMRVLRPEEKATNEAR